MAFTKFLLLAVALGVMVADLGVHGAAARNQRSRRRRSGQLDASLEVEPDRVLERLNTSDDPNVNVDSNDESILLDKDDFFGRSSAHSRLELFTDGNNPSSGSNRETFGTPGGVPQLQPLPEITRTFLPTDPRLGPSTEVIKVGSFPLTSILVTKIAVHTRVIKVVSTTTELYFSYVTVTVANTERPTITVVGECRPQPMVTRFVKRPTETLTVTVPIPVTNEPSLTFFFSKTSEQGNIVSRTNYKGADHTSNHADVNLSASSFTKPLASSFTTPRAASFTTPRTLPTESATGYYYSEPPYQFVHGSPSLDQKKVRRSARTFVNDYVRTVLNQ